MYDFFGPDRPIGQYITGPVGKTKDHTGPAVVSMPALMPSNRNIFVHVNMTMEVCWVIILM